MNKRLKKAIKNLVLLFAALYILNGFLLNLLCEVGNSRTHLNAYHLVNELSRAQHEYHLEQNKSDDWELYLQKKISDFSNLEHYQYSSEFVNNAAFSQAYEAVSKKDLCKKNLPALFALIIGNKETIRYTSIRARFFSQNTDTEEKTILCESKTPGWQKLNKPYLKNGKAFCGEGTTEFVVN